MITGNPVSDMIINIFILSVSIIFLWKGADYLVDSASRIAMKFGVSDLVVGLTIVAFGTSAPEFAVTINAALKEQSAISVGNIVGSNIFNTGFILGFVALFTAVQSTRKMIYRDGTFMMCISMLLLFFFRDFTLSKTESFIFILLIASYLIFLFVKKEPVDEVETHEKARPVDFMILPLSIAFVIAGGHYLVESSVYIARVIGLSEWIIGVTIVAFGTSAPEMATSLAAVLKGKHGLSAGNLIGSNIFNILGVLGLAGALSTLTVSPDALISMSILCIMSLIMLIFLRTGMVLSKLEGLTLIVLSIISYLIIFEKSL